MNLQTWTFLKQKTTPDQSFIKTEIDNLSFSDLVDESAYASGSLIVSFVQKSLIIQE
jgi:hypothetical protein